MISLLVIERSVLKVFSELSDDDSKHVAVYSAIFKSCSIEFFNSYFKWAL